MGKPRKRPQASKRQPKMGNEEYMRAMQELRRGSRTDRHASPNDYRRKPKNNSWEDYDE